MKSYQEMSKEEYEIELKKLQKKSCYRKKKV